MTVQIDFEASNTTGEYGNLRLRNPERDCDYASWPFVADGQEADRRTADGNTTWHWTNPDEPLGDITLAPSLKLDWDEDGFHIFVRDGEIEHCSDCACGCHQ
ncbi:hypothetical protein [Halomarina oriensis]|uniref:Uncharacterized protein n=1 Tax=Halomarina oriensis TaxID=671145 RepID=A0A6B0GVF7_9EURY|nr:hypothetical protein [Halomarina oriensis]MWG36573.1 hypothetical protein [Halomarina oriensis]